MEGEVTRFACGCGPSHHSRPADRWASPLIDSSFFITVEWGSLILEEAIAFEFRVATVGACNFLRIPNLWLQLLQ